MNPHDRLKHYLSEFAACELSGHLLSEVEGHTRSCGLCQDWLNGYQEIGMVLGGSSPGESMSHPNVDDLVRFALNLESLEQSKAAWIRRHLLNCLGCTEEVELCREAVGAANSPIADSRNPVEDRKNESSASRPERTFGIAANQDLDDVKEGPGRAGRTAWHGLWAAALVLAVLGAMMYVVVQRQMPEELVLTGETLRGTRLIEASERVEVSQSRIDVGAKVTLRAAKVSLGNGFSLEEGACLVIEAKPGSPFTQNKREEMQ